MKKHFFVVAAVLISSQLNAQADSLIRLLDEVVMTANKFSNKTSQTGKVVTVINREQLDKSGGKDLSQILTEQAGIYIAGANSNAGKDKSMYLRGARADHTLITIDGIPIYDPSGIGGNFDIRNIAIGNIEKIEILKGSQSTLYGSDAIAGVINIISKKISDKSLEGNAQLSYGSYNSYRGSAGLSGKKEKFDYAINYSAIKTDGINEALNNSNNADKDGYSQNNFSIQTGISVSKNIRIQPFFRYTKLKGDLDQGAFTDELDYTFSQKSLQAGWRNEVTLSNIKLNILYSFNSINRTYVDDSTKSRNGYDAYSRGNYKGGEHFLDAYAHIPLSDKIKLTGGFDFRSSHTDQEFFSVGFFGPYTSKYNSDSLKQNQVSVYAAVNFNSKSGFNLELGNRLNIHSEYGSQDVFNMNPSFLFNKKWKLFANFSSGYRTPSLYQLFSEYGNKKLQPESALTWEGGIQYFSADNKVTGRVTVFSRKVNDVIFFYFNPNTYQSQYINQDKENGYGVEWETKIKFLEKFSLSAFYVFVDGKIVTKENGKDSSYSSLLRRPKHSAGIALGSQLSKKLFISCNISAFGKRNDKYFDATSFQTIETVLKKYLLLDLYAEHSFKESRLKLFVDLRNITNSRYTEISGFNTLRFNGAGGLGIKL